MLVARGNGKETSVLKQDPDPVKSSRTAHPSDSEEIVKKTDRQFSLITIPGSRKEKTFSVTAIKTENHTSPVPSRLYNLSNSLSRIRSISINQQERCQMLSQWIDRDEISLKDLINAGLTDSELQGITPRLHYVDVRGMFSLQAEAIRFLTQCTSMVTLKVSRDPLFNADLFNSLPIFPHLRILNCSFCPLNELPSPSKVPALIDLNCNNCPVRVIPLYTTLQRLSCRNTPITEIPVLPTLEHLNCGRCSRLTRIATHLNSLTYLVCDNCPVLPEIPTMPELKKLFCRDCPQLATLGAMQKLIHISCHRKDNPFDTHSIVHAIGSNRLTSISINIDP